MNSNTPQDILLCNRTQVPSGESLLDQINALARTLSDVKKYETRIAALEEVIGNLRQPVPSYEIRTLNTDFIISATRNALVFYTIQLPTPGLLSGTTSSTVELIVNLISSAKTESLLTVILGLGLSLSSSVQKVLCGFVPVGCTVNLRSSGTEMPTITQSLEILL